MYKCSLIKCGFIDPRRDDFVAFNFEISKLEIAINEKIIKTEDDIFGFVLRMLLIERFPFINNYSSTESHIEIDSFGKEFDVIRGNGPCPECPVVEGNHVDVSFNLGVLY